MLLIALGESSPLAPELGEYKFIRGQTAQHSRTWWSSSGLPLLLLPSVSPGTLEPCCPKLVLEDHLLALPVDTSKALTITEVLYIHYLSPHSFISKRDTVFSFYIKFRKHQAMFPRSQVTQVNLEAKSWPLSSNAKSTPGSSSSPTGPHHVSFPSWSNIDVHVCHFLVQTMNLLTQTF